MEPKANTIPQTARPEQDLSADPNLYERIRARFAPLGGVDLEIPPREPGREPPPFE
nr:hypothetical protein [uncultured Rhodopila sp.]